MCGFVGFLALSDRPYAQVVDVSRAADTIRHRGPDDQGVWLSSDGAVGLGFRRLAILDLSEHGHQPMASSCGRYTIVFNGEIYNFQDLRAEMDRQQPCAWRGHSDTEVLLELIRRRGIEAALQAADGMFAIALWDEQDRTLTLARDRFGEKPLYYGWSDGALVFGSELKALKALPGFRDDLDQNAIAEVFRYRYVSGARCIYRHYRKLQAGHYLVLKNGAGEPRSYWDTEQEARQAFANPFTGTRDDALEQLDALFKASISRRLESDVPLGAFLSGGIDSSLSVAYAQMVSSRPVNTYTIGFEHEHFNEAPFAKKVADHLGAHHTEITVGEQDALAVVEHLAHIYDEPFADPSQIPTAVLCAKAKDHVTVALAGDGGDEFFCGYGRYDHHIRRWRRTAAMSPLNRRLSRRLADALPVEGLNALDGLRGKPGKLGRKVLGRLLDRGTDQAEAFFLSASSYWRDGLPVHGWGRQEHALFTPLPLELGECTDVERFQILDALRYLPDDVLVKTDRASMAASLEVRTPFLNPELVRFAWSLPFDMYDPQRFGLKVMLRDLLVRHVPRDLFERPKMGFDAPIRQWLRGDLKAWGEALVMDPGVQAQEHLDMVRIQSRWRAHQKGLNAEGELWPALMMLNWMQSV